MLDIARKRGIDGRVGTGEKLPFEDSVFDYVAIIITICFVKNPCKVLAETQRVLKAGGRIVLGIVDKDSFLGKSYRKKKSMFYQRAHFFSVGELSDLLRATGFQKLSYYQTIFRIPGTMRNIVKPRKGFGKGGFVVISARKPSQRQSATR